MNASDIVNQLKNVKGQHVKASWERQVKTPKECPSVILKRTTAYVRAGIDYANLKSVKDGIASGERGEVEPLPWGTWTEFPFIIAHNGVEYVRLYPAAFDNLKAEVSYTIDGAQATTEQVYAIASKGEVSVKDVSLETFAANLSKPMAKKIQQLVDAAQDARFSFADATQETYREIVREENLKPVTTFTLKAESLASIG